MPGMIAHALDVLVQAGNVFEIRNLKSGAVDSKRFTDHALAASFAADRNKRGWNSYFTFNPLKPDDAKDGEAKDVDVSRRRYLLIDADPVRPDAFKDNAASDSEKAEAERVFNDAVNLLEGMHGWTISDSGNGYHGFLPIDMANDDDAKQVVKAILKGLAERCNRDAAKIDVSVSNASRIVRLPGTLNCKGKQSNERPWRLARILSSTPWTVEAAQHNTDRLKAMAKEWGKTPLSEHRKAATVQTDRYSEAALAYEVLNVARAENQTRNTTLNEAAFSLGQLVADGKLPRGEVESALATAARGKGLPDDEIAKTLKSGLDAGATKPRPQKHESNGKHAANGKQAEAPEPEEDTLPILTFEELCATYPRLREPRIDGLLRDGETMNIIAASKTGKSWLASALSFAVATGGLWLGNYKCRQGNVLLIDNELHPETIAYRLRKVADAAGIDFDCLRRSISVLSLRGRLKDLHAMGRTLRKLGRDRFSLVVVDAFYRALPIDTDENDNGTMAQLYNTLDSYAADIGACFTLIHHASKGDQSGKAVTDVGSGAGAQSRATDTHLVLRPHEEENAVVLDAAVRSFAPVQPVCLQWDFPLWHPAPDLDPTLLRRPPSRRQAKSENSASDGPPDEPWTPERFATIAGRKEPRTRDLLIAEAMKAGLPSIAQGVRLFNAAVEEGYLFPDPTTKGNQAKRYANVKPVEDKEIA